MTVIVNELDVAVAPEPLNAPAPAAPKTEPRPLDPLEVLALVELRAERDRRARAH